MIHRLSDFSDLSRYRLPFIIIKPSRLKYRDIAVRVHDSKWPSVRFTVKRKGKAFRIKEFFLDWFFPGFPKSLLKDFSTTYSEVKSFKVSDFHIFYGKNYRKNDAAAACIFGTQVEVDTMESAGEEDFVALFSDLLRERPNPIPLSGYQFPDRSHFARGYSGEWYEDNRIARLHWRRTHRELFELPGHSLRSSGMGFLSMEGKRHEIFILEEREYRNGLWIENTEKNIRIDNAFYNVRKGDGFFDQTIELEQSNGLIIFRSADGPGVLQMDLVNSVVTAGFSPGFSIADIEYVAQHMEKLESYLEGIREKLRQEEAYL